MTSERGIGRAPGGETPTKPGLIAAAFVLLVAIVSPRDSAAEEAARTRLVLLPLQSYALSAEELDGVTRSLVERFRADPAIELVDAVPVLGEKAADDWLKADKLLYDGIQDYQDLQFVKAVEQLRESAELMERTFREFADVQGRRRMRDGYLHLGLARLEQGEQMEAEDWFAKAARVDPGFQPDPRAYPPAVRAQFLAVKTERLDASYEASRERLRELGKIVGVDVVVAGGVRHDAESGWFVEVAWVDRWSGRSAVETATTRQREDLPKVVGDAAPKLIAGVLQKPWPPIGTSRSRTRRRFTVGAAGAYIPDARIVKPAGEGGQVYRWNDDIRQGGVHFAITPWERGVWAIETDVALYFPQKMSDRGWSSTFDASGDFQGGGSLGAHVVRSVALGRWGLSAGAGLALNESIASFRSQQTETGVVFLWMTPVVTASATRTLLARDGLETFVELQIAANYDALGSGPANWMIQSVAGGGVAF